ncbi:hypothetical protein NL676_013970 [Syzygium grande]|nr:hypothetical protein NL676_013970 [Syzygium grande]
MLQQLYSSPSDQGRSLSSEHVILRLQIKKPPSPVPRPSNHRPPSSIAVSHHQISITGHLELIATKTEHNSGRRHSRREGAVALAWAYPKADNPCRRLTPSPAFGKAQARAADPKRGLAQGRRPQVSLA